MRGRDTAGKACVGPPAAEERDQGFQLADFDYDLPRELIAQEPLAQRDASRLLMLERARGRRRHRRFVDLPELLSPGDLLVLNDTRVLPARLQGRRADPGTSARVETLLVERLGRGPGPRGRPEVWRVLLRGPRRPGEIIDYGEGLRARVMEREQGELHLLEFSRAGAEISVSESLKRAGTMPLPPYIRRGPVSPGGSGDPREPIDRERYQTVFARVPGAVAAPTAGLHFTEGLIAAIRQRGVDVEALTLHVGPGTFQPVRVAS
ncbi:MAG: S-adenosylmethionine:tRNA ribosyltransferase-isomerase, partial [Acidobacteriota bacterium]